MKKNDILIIGSSGFIGTNLLPALGDYNIETCKGRELMALKDEDFQEMIKRNQVIINLAGYSVSGPWNKKKKELILNSRIQTTRKIVDTLLNSGHKAHLINASAIGLYQSGKEVDEYDTIFGKDFLAEVVKRWEEEVFRLKESNSIYTNLRIGVVLGRGGGAYSILRKLTRLNLGTYFSGGKQKISFIYLEDAINSIKFVIENEMSGPINLTSPKTTDYKEFMFYLKKKTGALVIWNMPAFVLKLVLGESSRVLLDSHDVKPTVLLKNSFNFIAPNIETCIDKLESN